MKLLKGVWIGFWSGLILGLLLKWIQSVTGENVYTLLLNIDFIPIIGNVQWSEVTEFIFHMIVSLVIGIVFVFLAKRRKYTFGQLVILSLLISIPLPFLFFILSSLAVTADVPAVNDWNAFLYWVFGHLTYSLLLSIFYKTFERKNAVSH
ncbi:hypothetical protein Plano_2011 [Planococcus sp. PAMC 21323]|uniref:hypothetical protein n=1 Tax=Planococcus sp. PAMC 21323 TaxID=1526927 RepID=UPI00056F4844|nr:hypothetical protein [Planococcus sp. PAMC 21323]AIY05976.1 hypothetical protein Plano_2011 [Planococcus sp. PAMC 21323]